MNSTPGVQAVRVVGRGTLEVEMIGLRQRARFLRELVARPIRAWSGAASADVSRASRCGVWQLSELFWDKVMKEQAWGMAIKLPAPLNGLALVLLFGAWFILNIGVLMVMENLSSFLHALRLQWVEFQNKYARCARNRTQSTFVTWAVYAACTA